jgi:hypothetical protein
VEELLAREIRRYPGFKSKQGAIVTALEANGSSRDKGVRPRRKVYVGVAVVAVLAIGGTALGLRLSNSAKGGVVSESRPVASGLPITNDGIYANALQASISGTVTFTGARLLSFDGLQMPKLARVGIAVPSGRKPLDDGGSGESRQWPPPTAPARFQPLIGTTVTGGEGVIYNFWEDLTDVTPTSQAVAGGIVVIYRENGKTFSTALRGLSNLCVVRKLGPYSCRGEQAVVNAFFKKYG